VIKVTRDPASKKEIERERVCRATLSTLPFARHTFHAPREIAYVTRDEYTILVAEYIKEERTFMEHTLTEQFFLALRAFEAQEGVQVTTSGHARTIEKTVGLVNAEYYRSHFEIFRARAIECDPQNTRLRDTLTRAVTFLSSHTTTI
jgi:hypothetical protein